MAAALAVIGETADFGGSGSTQDDLFGGEPGEEGAFEVDMPMPVAPVARSGPRGGRPKGAKNRSTEAWREYLLSRYRSPLVGLLEIASRSPKDLAKELGLYERVPVGGGEYEDRLATGEAFKAQIEAMRTALPYLHGKAAIEIKATDERRGVLNVFIGGDGAQLGIGSDGGLIFPGDDALGQPQQNQRVIDAVPIQSDEQQSDETQSSSHVNGLSDADG